MQHSANTSVRLAGDPWGGFTTPEKVQTISRSFQRGNASEETRCCCCKKNPYCSNRKGNEDKRLFLHAKSYRHTKPRQCGEKKYDTFADIFRSSFQINWLENVSRKRRDQENMWCKPGRKWENKREELREGEYTESFIWPTMRAFHVWNLDIINNKSSHTAGS